MDQDDYEYDCSRCEMAQVDYKNLERIVEDLSVLVRRLSHCVKNTNTDNKLHEQALDYLKRNNLLGSPIRIEELQSEVKK